MMACDKRKKTGSCGHWQCGYSSETEHGYNCVAVCDGFCEVGEGCLSKCAYAWAVGDTKSRVAAEWAFGWDENNDKYHVIHPDELPGREEAETTIGVTVGWINAYESGQLDEEEVIAGFQRLINTGYAWQLQGSYGRMAAALIEAGHCRPANSKGVHNDG